MDSLHIPQNISSNIMIILGGTDTVGRIFISLLGDRLKGYTLPMYTGLAIGMSMVNGMGAFATTEVHMILYASGRYSLKKSCKTTMN